MVHEIFKHALARTYGLVKSQHPPEGRRKWRLRALYASWPTLGSLNADGTIASDTSFESDTDPLDEFLEDDALGILIRTDFTNDEAWNTFIQKLQESQKELLSDLTGDGADAPADGNANAPVAGPSTEAADEESDSLSETPDIIKVLDATDPADRARLSNISNIAALRLFNDVDVRPTPAPPAGTKRISPPNPLIDQTGWQEIYTGKTLWIYDARSNTDECARLISQQPDFYGTATGDSWRARAAHIPELQFNMVYQGMKIDFNGMDKYDYNERTRNVAESVAL
ncbi:hypothetical protein BDN70DRAFT_936546 [Pholiota conissans]|uniref:Uncharacterized protein n=1 Tax=Pholiota conissans TaxID=109636 RepID=A0A9P5YTR3_9AGAR|nr:hypothetical protein BDN70DRAFT_936546 [Pholiota conissans]